MFKAKRNSAGSGNIKRYGEGIPNQEDVERPLLGIVAGVEPQCSSAVPGFNFLDGEGNLLREVGRYLSVIDGCRFMRTCKSVSLLYKDLKNDFPLPVKVYIDLKKKHSIQYKYYKLRKSLALILGPVSFSLFLGELFFYHGEGRAAALFLAALSFICVVPSGLVSRERLEDEEMMGLVIGRFLGRISFFQETSSEQDLESARFLLSIQSPD